MSTRSIKCDGVGLSGWFQEDGVDLGGGLGRVFEEGIGWLHPRE